MNARDLSTKPVTMTHMHFRLIAATIASLNLDEASRLTTAISFANDLASTNPRFDRARFLDACGTTED
jgi:hypothetical protein